MELVENTFSENSRKYLVIKLYEEPDARKPQVRFCEGQIDEPFTKEERKASRDCLLDGCL